jgi:hypothetical protein
VSDTKYKVHRVEIDNSMHRVVQVDDFAAAIAAKDAEIAALRAELAEARRERDGLRAAIEQIVVLAEYATTGPGKCKSDALSAAKATALSKSISEIGRSAIDAARKAKS